MVTLCLAVYLQIRCGETVRYPQGSTMPNLSRYNFILWSKKKIKCKKHSLPSDFELQKIIIIFCHMQPPPTPLPPKKRKKKKSGTQKSRGLVFPCGKLFI